MLSAILLLALQTTGETAVAVLPDAPETWVLEYPRIIQDEIDAYYGCLKSRGVISPRKEKPIFEAQHREHIPKCSKQLENSLTNAKEILIGRKHYEDYDEAKIAVAFETVGMIHVERGRQMDSRLDRYVDQHATYDAAYQQTPEQVSGGEQIEAVLPPTSQDASNAQD